MFINIVGMDPSMSHWGIVEASLNLQSGKVHIRSFNLVEPEIPKSKDVYQNSKDISRAYQLYEEAVAAVRRASIIFAEVPVGSQSARAMASYGICIGILAALQHEQVRLIQVTPLANKLGLCNSKTASKKDMIDAAVELYPDAPWLKRNGKLLNKNEHLADAVGAIHAGIQTQQFKEYSLTYNILRNSNAIKNV